MTQDICSAHSDRADTRTAAADLVAKLRDQDPSAIVFFCGPRHDGVLLCRELMLAFPRAQVIGCTTAGEFTGEISRLDSVSLLALGARKVRRAAAAIAHFERGVERGILAATNEIEKKLEVNLRSVDPTRYVGVVLLEGLRMKEEAANDALGNAAPLVSFVGASAGDNGEFKATRVFCNGEASEDGAALLLVDAAVPFVVGKTCSFEPKSKALTVTRADVVNRILYELDGRPVLQAYAELVGRTPEQLDAAVFMTHPLGLVIDGQPWIRSPQRVLPDGGLKLYCQVLEGAQVHVMRSRDLLGETRAEIARIKQRLGGEASGGLAFNCILRRLELDAGKLHGPFVDSFEGLEVAGFHTYGESWLGHINQTLTGLWFA